MAGETPDYRRLNAQTITFPVTDLGELASRIGSVDRYDRRGDVLDMWDFESGLGGWLATGAGSGNTVDLSMVYARSGSISARLVSGNAIDDRARIERGVPTPVSGLTGLECAFKITAINNRLEVRLRWSLGPATYEFAVRYRRGANDLQVLDNTNTYQTVAAVGPIDVSQKVWNGFKLVADLSALRYERVLLNQLAVDLSAYTPYNSGAATGAFTTQRIEATTSTNASAFVYVDDVIFTQGEPPN